MLTAEVVISEGPKKESQILSGQSLNAPVVKQY